MTFNAILRRFVALLACICLAASGTGAVWAQTNSTLTPQADVPASLPTNLPNINLGFESDAANMQLFLAQASTGTLGFDITAPTISHSPPISKGVAGEVQTVVAEISDNQSVERALLIYRNSTADFYSTTEMAADVTNTTWLATIDTTSDDELVHYYIVAEDTDGNRVQKGSESNPLTLDLQQAEFFSTIAPIKKNEKTKWIGIGLGVLVAMALVVSSGSGSSSGGSGGITNSDGSNNCCTITFVVPNVTTE